MKRPRLSLYRKDAVAIPKDVVGGVAEELEQRMGTDEVPFGSVGVVVGESTTHRTVRINTQGDVPIFFAGWEGDEE